MPSSSKVCRYRVDVFLAGSSIKLKSVRVKTDRGPGHAYRSVSRMYPGRRVPPWLDLPLLGLKGSPGARVLLSRAFPIRED